MSLSPDDVLRELVEISSRLDALPDGHPEAEALIGRRAELRAMAAERLAGASSPETLRMELKHLHRRLAALDGERVRVPKWQQQVGGKLTDPEAAGREINRRIDAANAAERRSLELRISQIRSILDDERQPRSQ